MIEKRLNPATSFSQPLVARLGPDSGALFSACGVYRWALWRHFTSVVQGSAREFSPEIAGGNKGWKLFLQLLHTNKGRWAHFIMLNPSVANASENDPTIRRCIGFARSWGYSGLVVTNLFPDISISPQYLKTLQPDALAAAWETNQWVLKAVTKRSLPAICAWGNLGALADRASAVIRLLKKPLCLGLTAKGFPKHPLYVPGTASPRPLFDIKP
jgi:hypothetical protein